MRWCYNTRECDPLTQEAADETVVNEERKMTNEKNNLHTIEIFTMGKEERGIGTKEMERNE